MGMSLAGDNKIDITASQIYPISQQKAVTANRSTMIDKLERKANAPELPPIGIKPCSPSYASTLPLDITTDSQIRRARRSPLSPTSTTSSHGGSSRRRSPSAGMMSRSRTLADLNTNYQSNGKLETLYELSTSQRGTGDQRLKLEELSLQEDNKAGVISPRLPPASDRHMQLQSTKTVTILRSQSTPRLTSLDTTKLPAELHGDKPGLKPNKLSHENLLKLEHNSGQSSGRLKKQSIDTGYDTDEEKEQRIVEWLIGVETSQKDEPPDVPRLTTNEKRDTAIHIIYEGD